MRTMDKQMKDKAGFHMAPMMNMLSADHVAKLHLTQMEDKHPDLFPIPAYLTDSGEQMGSEEAERRGGDGLELSSLISDRD